MDKPLISVILPVYNGERYLADSIDSILTQSFKKFELVIIDDGSNDSSKKIIESYDDPRIVFKSRENRGLGATLNELIDLSRAELVVRMDADDIMSRDRLYLQYNFMHTNQKCVLSGTQICYFNGVATISRTPFPELDAEIKKDLSNVIFSICHPSIIFRRSVAKKIGGYTVQGIGEDLDFFLRMGDHGEVRNISDIGLLYRYSSNSITATKSRELKKIYNFTIAKRLNKSLSYLSFEKSWHERSYISKFRSELEHLSDKFYSQYIIYYDIQNARSRIYLILASILKIKAVFRHLARRYSKKRNYE